MKVLLLNPPAEQKYVKESRCQHSASVFQSVYPPITLAYIAALLRNENEVMLLDAVGEEIPMDEVEKKFIAFKPDFVVVNTTTPTINNDLEVVRELKEIHNFKSVFFGVHATRFARELAKYEQVDFVVKGEPELVISDLVRMRPEEVSGIVYRRDEKIIENPDHAPAVMDELPFPAWDLVDLERYRVPIKNEPYVLLMTGRGCPYGCKFCVSTSYYGKKYRERSVESVIKEIEYAKSFGIKNFFFFVETFTLNKKFVLKLCDEIIKRNLRISWFCNSRVDTVDMEMLEKMKKAGCWMVSFGIESSSQRTLDNVRKGIKVEQSEKTIRNAHDAGIVTVGHFIFGLEGETKETMKDTLKFAKKLPLDFAEFYIATPFPGSELFDELSIEKHNAVDWSKFEYSYGNIPNKEELKLEEFRVRAYREFYMRPRMLYRMLRIFGFGRALTLFKTGLVFIRSI